MKFRKISAIAGSVLMTGLTVASAAAAAFPAPFVENGKADLAIVYGADADMVAANNVHTALGKFVTSTGATTVEGGETFALEKSSNKFNFNNALNAVYTDLNDEDMQFLADGTYDDGSIDEDYEQKITLGTNTLSLFADNDYNDDEPTVGFKFANTDTVLSYELKYDNTISFDAMEDTDLPLLGGEYYVLDSTSAADTLELLDSAEKTVLAEGETVTVAGKTVSIEYIADGAVKFSVDGELTDKLTDHQSYELEDESYIVANEVLYSDKEGSTSKVEFSIGKGKMVLKHNADVEINDEDVDGLVVTFGLTGDDLSTITLTWNSDDESFLTESNALTMPGFEALKLVYGGLDYATESEMISVDNGETLTLNMENYDLPVMWYNGAATVLGEEDYALILATGASAKNYTATGAGNNAPTGGIEAAEDNRFLITSMDNDLSDIETAYYEVTNIDYTSPTDFTVELKDLIGDSDLEFDALESHDKGDITVTLNSVDANTAYFTFTAAGTVAYNKAVSDKGLVVTLPTSVSITDTTGTATLSFQEADKDEDLEAGASFDATVKLTSNDKLHVASTTVSVEEESSDKFVGVVASDLASKISTDESGDEYDFSIEYFGKEVTADVQVATADAVVTNAAAADFLPVKATDIDTVKDKNLVIVGGSCINAAAATALGGAYCGEAFTEATGVSAGEFLIKEVKDKFAEGKIALVVAGYEAADTKNAVTYLTKTEGVDTSLEVVKGLEAVQDLA